VGTTRLPLAATPHTQIILRTAEVGSEAILSWVFLGAGYSALLEELGLVPEKDWQLVKLT
jgi:hypothetical protein